MIVLQPAFSGEEIPVVFTCDARFLPNTAVSLQSLMEHAAPGRNYDVILLHDGTPGEALARFIGMAAGRENISIRAVDASSLFAGYTLYTKSAANFTEITYYRVLLPWVLPDVQRVVYLDGDVLLFADVAQLYDTPMGDCLLAAACDICALSEYFNPKSGARAYWDNVLGLRYPERYFSAGVLLMNLAAFRAAFTPEEMVKTAASRPWKLHDQDMLNSLCNERLYGLSQRWNTMENLWVGERYIPPEALHTRSEALKDPLIVHFAGVYKPWINLAVAYTEEFWLVAARTPFFKELLHIAHKNSHMSFEMYGEKALRYYREGRIGLAYIPKFIAAWARHKLRGRKER